MIHTHQRPDRDEFVTIYEDNLQSSPFLSKKQMLTAFDKIEPNVLMDLSNFPYDYYSIMHYDSAKMAKWGKETIKAKVKGITKQLGVSHRFSSEDVRLLNHVYCKDTTKFCRDFVAGCRRRYDCQKPGSLAFCAKTCDYCPRDPTKKASITPKPADGHSEQDGNKGVCRDSSPKCSESWMRPQCKRRIYRKWFLDNCPKLCGFCKDENKGECRDSSPKCSESWMQPQCKREIYRKWFLNNCPKLCGFC